MTLIACQTADDVFMDNQDVDCANQEDQNNQIMIDDKNHSEAKDEVELIFRAKPASKRARRTIEVTSKY